MRSLRAVRWGLYLDPAELDRTVGEMPSSVSRAAASSRGPM